MAIIEMMNGQDSNLSRMQHDFALNVARLIQYLAGIGYQVAFGEAWRSHQEAERLAALNLGSPLSLHQERLAVDLVLRRNGEWLRRSEDYAEAGAFWKGLDPRNAWGGDFNPPRVDGNHFSMRYLGRR